MQGYNYLHNSYFTPYSTEELGDLLGISIPVVNQYLI